MSLLPRWMMWSTAAVVLAVAGGLIAAVVLSSGGGGGGGGPAAGQKALTDYTAALRPPTTEGGRIVQQEMKPSLGEFAGGSLDGPSFVSRARSWQLALARVRDQLRGITPPAVIASAGPLFVAAMDDYVRAAQLFERAGAAPQDQRSAALDTAVAAARLADQAFDRAAVVVQRALQAAGLPKDSALPDPTPAPSPSPT
ncbi:MAG TPA: hypothetical protein VGQ42_03645 [Candidatus Dormibacteraeota bacterium]|nr:hypothetical protein [Candidatus Dormibacteraeota bacterium]